MKTKQEIEELCAKRSELNLEQRNELARAIVENPETREIAIEGALANNDMELAMALIYNPDKIKIE